MLKHVLTFRRTLRVSFSRPFSRHLASETETVYPREMFAKWRENPSSVHSSWDAYFKDLEANFADSNTPQGQKSQSNKRFGHLSPQIFESLSFSESALGNKLARLIENFRRKGHCLAKTNPLGLQSGCHFPQEDLEGLMLEGVGIEEGAFGAQVDPSGIEGPFFGQFPGQTTPAQVLERLKQIYCGAIGFQFAHIDSKERREWLQARIERPDFLELGRSKKLELFERVAESQAFSNYCERKYSTHVRFGIDGLDSAISGLGRLLQHSAESGLSEVIFGMPHRGRHSVLSCVLGKPYAQMFAEFEERPYFKNQANIKGFSGDVDYHIGFANLLEFAGKPLAVSLLPNPSHLEAVYPVVLGTARARQELLGDSSGRRVLPVIVHGDAAMAAQGVVYEAQQMERLANYSVGGTLHVVLNNQIGFTTEQAEARSTRQPCDLGLAASALILHVNADEPEAVDRAFELALDFRMAFQADVYVNVIGYRRYGHYEQDMARFTQPLMCGLISKKEPMCLSFAKKLESEGTLSSGQLEERLAHYTAALEEAHRRMQAKDFSTEEADFYGWRLVGDSPLNSTGVSKASLLSLARAIFAIPQNFNAHKMLRKVYAERMKSVEEGADIDWATAEALSLASLLEADYSVRLTGEDVERGTFAHRHAVLVDQLDNSRAIPLAQTPRPNSSARLALFNSLLSEFGALGFEYGYSTADPNALVLWEAQFGDFINGAQIVVDNFIAAAERKWARKSALVVSLPHGADGQGPEHSNAHLERLLSLVDEDYSLRNPSEKTKEDPLQTTNIIVCNVTSPANYFHLLRRQMVKGVRKPLFLLSPKRLLRHKLVRSTAEEFLAPREFSEVFDDFIVKDKSKADRILVCSGQIYYDLVERRAQEKNKERTAIIRLEQIAPFPYELLENVLRGYNKEAKVIWLSEEPRNFGAWDFVRPRMDSVLAKLGMGSLEFVGRAAAAAPAPGWVSRHKEELDVVLKEAFK